MMQAINELLYDIGSTGILFLEILSAIAGIVGFVFVAKEKEKRKRLVVTKDDQLNIVTFLLSFQSVDGQDEESDCIFEDTLQKELEKILAEI